MTGTGVPIPSLEPSSEPDSGPWGITRALENAYYARDPEALRRIAHQVERQIAELRELLAAAPAVK